jgi:hypothetical protein
VAFCFVLILFPLVIDGCDSADAPSFAGNATPDCTETHTVLCGAPQGAKLLYHFGKHQRLLS